MSRQWILPISRQTAQYVDANSGNSNNNRDSLRRNQNTNTTSRETKFSNLDAGSLRRIAELLNHPSNVLAYRSVNKATRRATGSSRPNPYGVGNGLVANRVQNYKNRFSNLLSSAIAAIYLVTQRCFTYNPRDYKITLQPGKRRAWPYKRTKNGDIGIQHFVHRYYLNGTPIHGSFKNQIFQFFTEWHYLPFIGAKYFVLVNMYKPLNDGTSKQTIEIKVEHGRQKMVAMLQRVTDAAGKLVDVTSSRNEGGTARGKTNGQQILGYFAYEGLVRALRQAESYWRSKSLRE